MAAVVTAAAATATAVMVGLGARSAPPPIESPAYYDSPSGRVQCATAQIGRNQWIGCTAERRWSELHSVDELSPEGLVDSNTVIAPPRGNELTRLKYGAYHLETGRLAAGGQGEGNVACRVARETGIECRNAEDHGFRISADGGTTF